MRPTRPGGAVGLLSGARIHEQAPDHPKTAANLRTKILDFRGFYSSIILNLRGGIPMSIGLSPEVLSQQIVVWITNISRETGRREFLWPRATEWGAHHAFSEAGRNPILIIVITNMLVIYVCIYICIYIYI